MKNKIIELIKNKKLRSLIFTLLIAIQFILYMLDPTKIVDLLVSCAFVITLYVIEISETLNDIK